MKPPEKAAEVLTRMLKAAPLGQDFEHVEIYSVWRSVVGAEVGRHTRVVGIKANVLRVEVDSSPWLYELTGFRKKTLLRKLSQALKKTKVVDIQFKIGDF